MVLQLFNPDGRFQEIALRASQVFVPATPIQTRELFAGRLNQLNSVFDAINQPGLHAVLYGDRGVGKTSLANVISVLASAAALGGMPSSKINCDKTDTFSSVWKKAFRALVIRNNDSAGKLIAEPAAEFIRYAESISDSAVPDDIRNILSTVTLPGLLIVFDEFDRLPRDVATNFTDCLKSLSDYSTNVTVVIVGVASTVSQLIRDHSSIERAVLQIHMPRMLPSELWEILTKGTDKLGMSIANDAALEIVQLSQGLPHYTHLLALHSVRAALIRNSLIVEDTDIAEGIARSVESIQESTKHQYYAATNSSRKDALFEHVLLACALSKKDSNGCFKAKDIVKPLRIVGKSSYEIPAFARHLSEFCDKRRGNVLTQFGEPRRRSYRFTNPLLEPFAIMRGLASGLVTRQDISDATTDY